MAAVLPPQTPAAIPTTATKDPPPFDPTFIRARYAAERDKRLAARPEGNAQYKAIHGLFDAYLVDPYTPRTERDPISEDLDFLVLGGGYGGLCLAARLVEAGIADMRVIDKAGDFGGTWYWNRYPGAACDIESYVYMPLLEETGYIPSEKYAKAPELLAHAARIGRHFGLYSRALFHTEGRDLVWDSDISRWIVTTDRGDTLRARFVATASGPLNMPKLPGVPGIESFAGHKFHTSRWDYGYTGGDGYGNLEGLKDKRVGIIGTGATAVQAVPHLAAAAKELFVFQRTPSSVGERNNRPTDPEWAASLTSGWQRRRMDNFLSVLGGAVDQEDLVGDGWTAFARWMREHGVKRGPGMWAQYATLLEQADMANMEKIRGRCLQVVRDEATARSLMPWYRQWCKRPCFHDEFLASFNRPSVTLVDTDGRGVDRITEKGVVVQGKEYELDCLIYATGFEVGTRYEQRSHFAIRGEGGVALGDYWADGAKTLQGFYARGFPNLFVVSTLQSGYAANFVHMLEAQGRHLAWLVRRCLDRGVVRLEAGAEAEKAWTEGIVKGQYRSAKIQAECTPGYYNLEGTKQDDDRQRSFGNFGGGPLAFARLLEEWRAKGDMEGLEFTDGEGERVVWKVENAEVEKVEVEKAGAEKVEKAEVEPEKVRVDEKLDIVEKVPGLALKIDEVTV
ncbi:putative monooxygenase [Trichodelitschia bisporula]|uniref:Putative monooxygenase n=1 Tax=Trichodelitschia bisporula TaxID=703511 RepID=A0A6G1HHR3_9PEZI|nr:putative monooxygenase [Trichodelitschia bisporula]